MAINYDEMRIPNVARAIETQINKMIYNGAFTAPRRALKSNDGDMKVIEGLFINEAERYYYMASMRFIKK